MTTPLLYTRAFAFLQTHEGEHLTHDQNNLVDRCIAHLVADAHVSYDTAKDTTLQALGELSARRRLEYIDCSRTTSYALFLVDVKGEKRVFTVAELLQMISHAKAGPVT